MRALVGQGRGDGQVGAGVAEQAVDAFAVAGVHADPQALLHERRQSVGQPRGDEVGGAGDVQRAGQVAAQLVAGQAGLQAVEHGADGARQFMGGVGGVTPRARRRNSGLPTKASSAWMCRDAAGWVMPRRSAAREKDESR